MYFEIGAMLCAIVLSASLSSGAETKYPLKVSENGRYLVDAGGKPFLIAGESPQAMMVNCSSPTRSIRS